MNRVMRRSVVTWMMRLPFVASAIGIASAKDLAASTPSRQCGSELLGMARWVNTLEYRFKMAHQSYGSADELIEEWVNWAAEAEDEQTREKIRQHPPQMAVPEWTLRLHLSLERDAYLLSLTTDAVVQPNVLASDEKGVIYVGTLPQTHVPAESYAPLDEIYPGLSPLQMPQATTGGKLLRLARQLAFGGIGGDVQLNSSCDCQGQCQGSPQPGCCNLGTLGCPWCCYASCSGCYYICYVYCQAPCTC